MSSSPPPSAVTEILAQIDTAHASDPNKIDVDGEEVPYELHYAQKSSAYLDKRCPDASPALRIAVRAQHFRRWEVPRSDYPEGKVGYFAWRGGLKKRQAEMVEGICGAVLGDGDGDGEGGLIRKENLKNDTESQVLEDVACLVFLDDQFAAFEKEHNEDKIITILRKTWAKMSEEGRRLALEIPMEGRPREVLVKALGG
ncbi:glutamyl-tRNA synthetase [Massarina eburnea CBS 473.64]|uniref:Glutamyl-tRNA synthetase n=1 Tax=Massarina eburnea CBS 473.64 TaxID=1395130 RepID=A0A6A6SDE4_9PLEO|nr:glutamyl-tRNA synthetase [Massarina eburnea CBS 473.64]